MLNHLIGFHPSLSALALRLALGLIFIVHGYLKLSRKEQGHRGIAAPVGSGGVAMPSVVAYGVGIAETVGGLLLVLGLLTRLAALLLVLDMALAILLVRWKTGFLTKVTGDNRIGGFELEFALLTMASVVFVLGSGKFSVEWIVFRTW